MTQLGVPFWGGLWGLYRDMWGLGFPKIIGTLGISIISIIVIWGLCWGPLFMETIKCAQALAQMKGKPKMFGSSNRVVAATAIIQHRVPPLNFRNKPGPCCKKPRNGSPKFETSTCERLLQQSGVKFRLCQNLSYSLNS